MNGERVAAVAKALAHPVRVQIVELLARQTECRGAELFGELPLAQSTVSEHIRVMKEAGIVSTSSCGPSNVYCLNPSVLAELGGFIAALSTCCSECAPKGAAE